MAISTDIASVVREALDRADIRYFVRSVVDEDGDQFDDFLIRYSYDQRVHSEIDYMVVVQSYTDNAKILTIRGSNTIYYPLDRRAQLLEAINEFASRYRNPKVVLITSDEILQTRSEVHFPVSSGITAEIFDAFLGDFLSANFQFLRWMADTDHGRNIPPDEDDGAPEASDGVADATETEDDD